MYYWKGRPNFGDLLGPLLVKHFADLDTDWASSSEADMVTVGSVLDVLKKDWAGIVAGAGKLQEFRHIILPQAKILGVRGPLTARGLKGVRDTISLGDPGLLANELVEVNKEYALGIVPHWSDNELEYRPEFLKYNPLIIRPEGDPLDVVRKIGSCRKIVSSSLHGIILADAFGMERRIEMTERFNREGGDYKFRDHNRAVGVDHTIGLTQLAPKYIVQNRKDEIFDMLRSIPGELEAMI
jgi:pyruvyltransferase